jgi:hypothetical protein
MFIQDEQASEKREGRHMIRKALLGAALTIAMFNWSVAENNKSPAMDEVLNFAGRPPLDYTADFRAKFALKPWHPRHPRAVGPACPFGGGHALIECDADPACLPPNNVTAVIAVLDVDDKIE